MKAEALALFKPPSLSPGPLRKLVFMLAIPPVAIAALAHTETKNFDPRLTSSGPSEAPTRA